MAVQEPGFLQAKIIEAAVDAPGKLFDHLTG